MRNDGTRRRSPLSNLFAPRQVYMRSGAHSDYVVLSRRLQIGVALGFIALLSLLAIASYNAIARQFEVVAQRQALADLEAAALEDDRSAEPSAGRRERNAAAEAEVLRLSAALEDARAGRQTAASAASAAEQKIAELNAALDQAQTALGAARSDAATRVQELGTALAAATAESRNLATQLQEIRASGEVQNATLSTRLEAALTEATGLRAELDRANRAVAALRTTAQAPQQSNPGARPGTSQSLPPGAPPVNDEPAGGRATRPERATGPAAEQILLLKEELAGAQATIDALTADLAAAKGGPTGPGQATAIDVAAEPEVGEPPLPSPPAPR